MTPQIQTFDPAKVKAIIRNQWPNRHSGNLADRNAAIAMIMVHIDLLRKFSVN